MNDFGDEKHGPAGEFGRLLEGNAAGTVVAPDACGRTVPHRDALFEESIRTLRQQEGHSSPSIWICLGKEKSKL